MVLFEEGSSGMFDLQRTLECFVHDVLRYMFGSSLLIDTLTSLDKYINK